MIERRASFDKNYDLVPALGSKIDDMALKYSKTYYLPLAIDKDTLFENGRNIEEQLASLRFYDAKEKCPTNGGTLIFGQNPEFYLPGVYLQYVKFSGEDMSSDVLYEKKFSGALKSLITPFTPKKSPSPCPPLQ